MSRTTRWTIAALVALVVAVYAPTLRHGFVWDDHEQVVDNPHIRDWSSLPELFRHDVLQLSRGGEARSNYYRPLFWVQYLVYYRLFGTQPAGWHAMAILHHALATLAALVLLVRLGLPRPVAGWAAALFAVHPAHGESVAWVAAAFNDPPAATAVLLGLAAWAGWHRTGRAGWLAPAALGYAVALGLKESSLAMLALVPLVDWYLTSTGGPPGKPSGTATDTDGDPSDRGAERSIRRSLGRRVAGYAPFVALTVLYFAIRKLTILTAFGVYDRAMPLGELAATLPGLLLFYLRVLVWPFGLAPSYPIRAATGWGAPELAAAAAVLAVAAAVWLAARRRPVVGLAALWTLCCLAPALNVRSFRPTYLVHQRYLYLAVLGVCLAAAWIAWKLIARPAARAFRPAAGWALLAGLAAVWAASTLAHHRYWADDEALWRRVAAVDPANPASFDWLGARALDEGRVEDAEALFRRAIDADPESPWGWRNLALLVHTRRHRPAEALPLYERALAAFEARGGADPEAVSRVRVSRAVCLAETGRRGEALDRLLEIAEAPPYPAEAARNAAVLLAGTGGREAVAVVLERAAARHPDDPELRSMLVDVYRAAGEPERALVHARRLAELRPGSPDLRRLVERLERDAG
jgi:tetratricopeptide (TPR) repeat protein